MQNISKKYIKSKLILNYIKDYGPVSRVELKNFTDVRLATITEITKELINSGVVIESGNDKSTNLQKKKLLYLNDDAFHAVGIDIQTEKIIAIATNLNGAILGKVERRINPGFTKAEITDAIVQSLHELISRFDSGNILGIGIANPAVLDREKINIMLSLQMEVLKEISIKSLVEENFHYPVYLEASDTLNLLAEKWFGNAKNINDILYIEAGVGIGISMVSDGNFVRGFSGMTGELGHTVVAPNGALCTCGNYGCLETVASTSVIVKKVADILQKGAASMVRDLADGDLSKIDIHLVLRAAEAGDKIAISVLEDAAKFIGISVSNVINLIGPQLVIFGGQLFRDNNFVIEVIKRVVKSNVFPLIAKDLIFKSAEFHEDGGALGAAALVFLNYFEYDNLKNMGML